MEDGCECRNGMEEQRLKFDASHLETPLVLRQLSVYNSSTGGVQHFSISALSANQEPREIRGRAKAASVINHP